MSGSEIVRRAIDAYDPSGAQRDELAGAAIEAMGAALRKSRLDLAQLRRRFRQAAVDNTNNCREIVKEVERRFHDHPEELLAVQRFLGFADSN